MSQRNPLNERYTTDEHIGVARKSAASAKPKTKAASTVTVVDVKKDPREKKAARKAEQKKAQEKQRELDRKYYKPDTERYKKLRRLWWIFLIGAVVCTLLSYLLREVQPSWIAMATLFLAYALIIAAFYLDFSKIKKERQRYQERMLAEEEKQAKAAKASARASQSNGKRQDKKKGSGKNQNRAAKPKQPAFAHSADTIAGTGGAGGTGGEGEAGHVGQAADESAACGSHAGSGERKGLFGGLFGTGRIRAEKKRVQAAQQAAAQASSEVGNKRSAGSTDAAGK